MSERSKIYYSGEEVSELLSTGKKIVTLRQPHEKYAIPAGTLIDAICPEESASVALMILANDVRQLNEFPEPTLLMDGYSTAEIAAEDLRKYYAGVEVSTPMQRIATMPESVWRVGFSEAQKELLLREGLDAAILLPDFRRIFLPSMLFWFGTYEDATIESWNRWSVDQGLVSQQEIDDKQNVDEYTRDYSRRASRFSVNSALKTREDAFYRNIVLHEPISLETEL